MMSPERKKNYGLIMLSLLVAFCIVCYGWNRFMSYNPLDDSDVNTEELVDVDLVRSQIKDFNDKVFLRLDDEYSKMNLGEIKQIIYFESISFLAHYYALNDKPNDVKTLILALVEEAERLWDSRNGGYWDFSKYPSYMRTSMYTRSLADTIQIMGNDFTDDQLVFLVEVLKKNADWLCGERIASVKKNNEYDFGKHSASANQNIAKISALYKAYNILKEEKYLKEMELEIDWVNENQWVDLENNRGYYTEHNHFDIGYSQVQMLLLNDIYYETNRIDVLDKVKKMWNHISTKVINEKYELDTSDSFIVRDKYATLGIPSVFFCSLINEINIGKDLIEGKYNHQLEDGLLDISSEDSLILTTSDYYLRLGKILMYCTE